LIDSLEVTVKLDEKTAIVTGAGRGIGRAIALKLTSEGAGVIVNDLDPGPANETVDLIDQARGMAIAVPGSVTQPGFTDSLVESALEGFGTLDIIVNNAGYTWDSVIQKTSDEQWQAMLDIHLTAPFRMLRSAAPYLRATAKREAAEGRPVVRKVVNVSSIAGTGGNVGQAGYAAGKAGVIGLTKTMAKEWGRSQVTVNAVAFGLIKTRLTEAPAGGEASINIDGRDIRVGIGAELLEAMESGIPLGRSGTPEDAANAVYLFCTPESDYITGQVVVAGGGLVL
jgi:3-oxoacyl-[acyl-carrier protein] reductase